MEENLSIYYVKKILDIIRDIDKKSSDITATIDEDGLDDKKDYSQHYAEIGKRLVELHGLDDTYFSQEITNLLKIVFDVIEYDNQYDISEEDLYKLCFSYNDKQYKKAKKDFFDMLNGKKKRFEDSLVDFSLGVFDEDSELPLFYNVDESKWSIINKNTISYKLNNNSEQLHGIIIPNELQGFFEIDESFLAEETESYEVAKKIKVLFKKKVYDMALYSTEGKAYLVWLSDLRKRILRKYPGIFSFIVEDESVNSGISIYFNKTFLNENKYYKLDFQSE